MVLLSSDVASSLAVTSALAPGAGCFGASYALRHVTSGTMSILPARNASTESRHVMSSTYSKRNPLICEIAARNDGTTPTTLPFSRNSNGRHFESARVRTTGCAAIHAFSSAVNCGAPIARPGAGINPIIMPIRTARPFRLTMFTSYSPVIGRVTTGPARYPSGGGADPLLCRSPHRSWRVAAGPASIGATNAGAAEKRARHHRSRATEAQRRAGDQSKRSGPF
ncbi:hypothetical protein F01_500053 [Burkholderia cenocepacia]|nr:hypothetical protein F01_500053 [Burkholderia cenocepacia]